MKRLVARTLEIAQSQVGVREVGTTNTGVQVNKYLASVGLGPGSPWCAAFVFYCINQAAKDIGVPNPFVRSAYCPDLESWAKRHGCLYSTPEAGDVFLHYSKPSGERYRRASHTGFVTAVDGQVKTIEGNTNTSGSRSGIGVFRLTRSLANMKFIRWAEVVPESPEEIRSQIKVTFNGEDVGKPGWITMGTSYVPIRALLETMGIDGSQIEWDSDGQVVVVKGSPLDIQTVEEDGSRYAAARDLAEDLDLTLAWDKAKRTVKLGR
jgi:hypothetical protein